MTDKFVRGLIAPDKSRWIPMLLSLAVSFVGIAAVVRFRPPELIASFLVALVFAAWFVGACAMIGYVRWIFASEVARVKRDSAGAIEKPELPKKAP